MVFSINANDETAKQQMELGNLTSHDLEYMNNVSRPTIYPISLALIGMQVAWKLTPVKSGTPRAMTLFTKMIISGTAGTCGLYAGNYVAGRVMKRNYRALDNPGGYQAAVQAIYEARSAERGGNVSAINWTYGIVVATATPRVGDQAILAHESDSEESFQSTSDREPETASPQSLDTPHRPETRQPQSQAQTSSTRWDEIRNRQGSAQPTAWDLIRQRHERERLPPGSGGNPLPSPAESDFNYESQPPPLSNDTTTVVDPQENGELSEQEKFNALLEAERRASAQSPDAYATWGERAPKRL